MPLDFEDIEGTAGQDNTAGIQQNIYLVDFKDVLTHPTFPKIEDGTDLASLATVTSNLVLKPTKKAHQLYCTLEAGAATSDSQGELDGMSFKNGLKFLIPGNKANADGFVRLAKNGSFYLIYFEQDGTVRILGHPGYPAKMASAPGTSGEKTSDRKGRTITFQSVWSGPAPVFEGKVMVDTVEQVLVYLA
ncbi:hypothetical protein Q5H92_22875 [Hymenobacter sp. M29]|uniref:Uncharacterized protein n=1 Tax=Hymenobacter mellowenesis TaxID=3063995 RepID=A0ABT9AHA5_9BACT|nr:hypothetical protein [Hymenobacter sp. M29]MDO7849226.1 hypothetical protein [Hymenobacter sp. M29]